MMPMTLAQVAQAVHGSIVWPKDAGRNDGDTRAEDQVTTGPVVSDSRQAVPGAVFVAIKGERVDGHDFVGKVAQMGAVAALVDHAVPGAALAQILVEDTVEALGLLAQANLAMRRMQEAPFSIVGITGSVGKTTTKDLLKALLSSLGETVAPVGSFNNNIGLPLTALQVGEDTRYLVAEMGANHVGEIAGLTRIAPPDVSVVLKVGTAHLGEFGSVERIAQAKSEIVKGLLPGGVTILNADDERVAAMRRFAPGKVLWFGAGDCRFAPDAGQTDADMLRAGDVSLDALDRAHFTLIAPEGSVDVTLGIPGAHNVSNALAAASVARHFGMPLADIAVRLGGVSHISPHRMAVSSVERAGVRFTLIDDSFNANPDSMRAGLDGLNRWDVETDSSTPEGPYRVAVLGAMLELGEDDIRLHRQIGRYAAELGIDAVVAVGSKADKHFDELAGALHDGAQGVRSEASAAAGQSGRTPVVVQWVHDTDEADEAVVALARLHPNMVVLLKGSHFSGLSALAERWSNQGAAPSHRDQPRKKD